MCSHARFGFACSRSHSPYFDLKLVLGTGRKRLGKFKVELNGVKIKSLVSYAHRNPQTKESLAFLPVTYTVIGIGKLVISWNLVEDCFQVAVNGVSFDELADIFSPG